MPHKRAIQSQIVVAHIPLKVAIAQSELKIGDVALRAGIQRWRLSRILHGHVKATRGERREIARALHRRIVEVFPDYEAVSA